MGEVRRGMGSIFEVCNLLNPIPTLALEGEGILDQCKYHIRTTLSKRSILHESGFFVRKGELMSHGF
jgi:hypothetical protein